MPQNNEQYILYQCGTPQPTTSQLPPVGTKYRKFFSVPVQRVIITETTTNTLLKVRPA